jgi:hypothetical protein
LNVSPSMPVRPIDRVMRGHHVAQPRAQWPRDPRWPELVGDQVGGPQAGHVLAQQRVVVDRIAQLHRVLDLTLTPARRPPAARTFSASIRSPTATVPQWA